MFYILLHLVVLYLGVKPNGHCHLARISHHHTIWLRAYSLLCHCRMPFAPLVVPRCFLVGGMCARGFSSLLGA
ncbi:hypothetical protein F4825DRAFT_445527 [Nemania diffusa]|nr:hypothetical protein F4825DRAFT_445527 [Nemania diffusa]